MGLKFVDTDVLVDIRRQWPAATAWFGALTSYPIIPGFVALELFAAHLCQDPADPIYTDNTKHFRAVDGLVIEQPYAR